MLLFNIPVGDQCLIGRTDQGGWVIDARGWGGNGNRDAVQTSWSIKRVRGESWWLADLGSGTGSSQQLHGGIITVAYLMSCPPRWTGRSFPLLTVTALMLSTWPSTEEALICLQWIKWVVRSSKMVGEKGSVLMDSYIFSVKAFFLWDESLKQNSNSASYKPHADHVFPFLRWLSHVQVSGYSGFLSRQTPESSTALHLSRSTETKLLQQPAASLPLRNRGSYDSKAFEGKETQRCFCSLQT